MLACSVWLGAVAAAEWLALRCSKMAVANSGMAFDFLYKGAKSCGWHQRTGRYRPKAEVQGITGNDCFAVQAVLPLRTSERLLTDSMQSPAVWLQDAT